MGANKKCVMNVFLMDKTTQLFVVQLYLCVYKYIFPETTYNLEPNGYLEFFNIYLGQLLGGGQNF